MPAHRLWKVDINHLHSSRSRHPSAAQDNNLCTTMQISNTPFLIRAPVLAMVAILLILQSNIADSQVNAAPVAPLTSLHPARTLLAVTVEPTSMCIFISEFTVL
ncbi:hypothetical protein D9758_004527 [Tetrapyrgos nigripes]|uniref:Uncharacterized protein n=1 Tax=Tetrapyrgos nigripes TaxID=182062 RepID=A0A8H5H0J5_9AGAR|nr:hypothetical protein D9758_004527 [Tetrapyrgos nigripes]